MNERILVRNNELRAQAAVDGANQATKTINNILAPALKSIAIPFTQKVLADIFGGNDLVEKSYYATLSKDLSNIKTPAVSDSMRLNADVAWTKFKSSVTSIRHEVGPSHQHLNIVEGEAFLTMENEEVIREIYRIYLTDEKEIAAYRIFIDVADKLNQLFKGNPPLFISALWPADAAGIIHVNENIDYTKFI